MTSENINPLEAVANITDIMLVLAVALMLALISRLGISMGALSEVDESNLLPVTPDITPSDIMDSTSGKGYREVGTVYEDPETGKKYYIED
jgi:hypothetical protein